MVINPANFKGIKICVEGPGLCTICCFDADKLWMHCVPERFYWLVVKEQTPTHSTPHAMHTLF